MANGMSRSILKSEQHDGDIEAMPQGEEKSRDVMTANHMRTRKHLFGGGHINRAEATSI